GFEIPVRLSDLVLIRSREAPLAPAGAPAASAPASAALPDGEAPTAPSPQATLRPDAQGSSYALMLAFTAPVGDKTELYLLNDSPYHALYSVGMYEQRSGNVLPLAQGAIAPDSKLPVKTLHLSELRVAQTLRVEAILYKNIPYAPHSLETADVTLQPVKFFRQGVFVETEFFDEKVMLLPLFSSEGAEKEQLVSISAEALREAMLQKNDLPAKPTPQQASQAAEVEEVDLHAEMLVSSPEKLPAGELLALQLARFTAMLENALKSGRKGKIVFIHGIGSGKLKLELRRCLDHSYPDVPYFDASFREYGYGATMVVL
ncbi:MAG: DUF2027 domain-containing protein, partial [Prevotellaceae bacterium]|nr:DUF2027 domain-containing protein [Prevotellaceae bacterium]